MKISILFCVFMISALWASAESAPVAVDKPLPSDSIYNLESVWVNQDNKNLKLSDYRGKPVIISMVYLKCQFSCPLTVAQLKETEKKLNKETKKKTQFLLVTFDTINDTPEAVLKYVEKNKIETPRWSFLTSTNETQVRELSTLIDFKYKKLESGEFEHSYALIALDSEGRIVGRTEGAQMEPQVIADIINKLK